MEHIAWRLYNMNKTLYDFINRFFYGKFERILIIDMGERKQYEAEEMTVKQMCRYTIKSIENIDYDTELDRFVIRV